jgi:hypothetical protein
MTRWLRILFVVSISLLAVYIGGYWVALHHRFPIDVEEVSSSGEARFVPQNNYEQWIHAEVASAVWWRGGLFVRHLVSAQGGLFTFTSSGRVFVLRPPESDGVTVQSPICIETVWWTKDPLAFPFSKHTHPEED